MGKARNSKRKHASSRKLANKSLSKQVKRQRDRKKEERNTRGDSTAGRSQYISQNIERTNFTALNDIDGSEDELTDERLEQLLSIAVSNKSEENDKNGERVPHPKRRNRNIDNIEEYERMPRKLPKHYVIEEGRALLPIKSKEGVIKQTQKTKDAEEPSDEVSAEENDGNDESVAVEENIDNTPQEITMAQLFQERHHHFLKSKIAIADICQSILGNPEEKIGLLKTLITMCGKNELLSVRKMAVLSACEVFKDIAPGYRIRALTEEEKTMKVSKDVKKLREFEEILVGSYRKYLDVLEEVVNEGIKANKKDASIEDSRNATTKALVRFGILSVKCLADLLTTLPHFNYRTNIIACLIPKMDLGGTHREVVNICFDAIKDVFKNDLVGDISLEVVKLISKYTKPRIKKVHPVLLDVLLHLNIDPELVKGAEKTESKLERLKKRREEISKMSRMERKRKKLEEKLNKELKETEAVESHSKVQKLHTEILKFVFVIYFRVVKIGRRTPLLSASLKGLSKFAYLINIDFFHDLMKSLQILLQSENLSMTESINCVLTAMKILTGQGEALNIDPQQFYLRIYSLLLELGSASNEDVALCCECLQLMLVKRRKQVSFQRMIGYLKRITSTTLQLSSGSSLTLLGVAKSILQMNRRCDCLLDNESVSRGVFRPELPDPEHCNADGTALWEQCLTAKHYWSDVRELSNHILKGAPSHGVGALSTHSIKRLSVYKTDETKLDYYFPSSIPKEKNVKSSKKKIGWDNYELEQMFSRAVSWSEGKVLLKVNGIS